MGAVSISSLIVTLFTYVQRIGMTINLPGVEMPQAIKDLMVICVDFYNTIETAIPDIPDLDFRSQLVILALGIPVALDIVFVWFISPFYDVIMHILDMIGVGGFMYFLTSGIFLKFDQVNITWTIVCAVYILSRVVLMFYGKNKTNDQLFQLVKSICGYFMGNVFPDQECEITFKDLNIQMHKFSKLIEIVPAKPVFWKTAIWLGISLILIVGGFYCAGTFSTVGQYPDIVKTVLPIIVIPIGVLIWVGFLLQTFALGRKAIVAIKQFIRRWGLRLLMLVLDILYIPILQCLIYHMTPVNIGCEKDFYLYYQRKGTSLLDPFINKSVECLPCARKIEGECIAMCDGITEMRMKSSPGLLFKEDVIEIMAGVIVYTFGVILIGIPLMWFFLVKRNSGFVKHINVYGATSEDKWQALTNRLHTTGIFIFEDYKMERCYWCVVQLIMKFLIMLIETVSEVMWEPFIVMQPVFYAVSCGLHIYFKPYMHTFNNIFESLLEGINCIFSIFSVFTYFGVHIPDVWTTPIMLLLFGIPVVSCFFILCIEGEKGTEDDLDDPTFLRKANHDVSRSNSPRGSVANTPRIEKSPGGEPTGKDDMERLLLEDDGDDHYSNELADGSEEEDYPLDWELAETDSHHIIVEEKMLDCICDAEEREKEAKVSPAEDLPLVAFEVRRRRLAKMMTKMYETLDVVLDGSTMELLTKILDTVVIFGCAVVGWYLGALLASHQKATEIVCG